MTARLTILLIATSLGVAHADPQHEGHQTPATRLSTPLGASPASNPACAQGGVQALAIVEAANARVGTSLPAADAAGVRRTLADAEMAIAAAQAQLFACRGAVSTPVAAAAPASAMAGMDHSKMNMGKPGSTATPTAPGTKPADAMAGMDHSKMNMGKPASAAKPAAPGAKPAAKPADAMAGMDHSKMNMGKPASPAKRAAPGAKPAAKPADGMAGMDHSKMAMPGAAPKATGAAPPGPGAAALPTSMAERIADPACPGNVGQAAAPKMVYRRKVYYFCSSKARDEFRKDPAAYLTKHPR